MFFSANLAEVTDWILDFQNLRNDLMNNVTIGLIGRITWV